MARAGGCALEPMREMLALGSTLVSNGTLLLTASPAAEAWLMGGCRTTWPSVMDMNSSTICPPPDNKMKNKADTCCKYPLQ